VLGPLGETVVLCAVTARRTSSGAGFLPADRALPGKFSAAGRIPGGFFKRERGATEKETLTSRLIDRPIRRCFPEGFYNEVNVIAHVMSYDGENEPDVVAMIAASAALTISGVPFMGPIAAPRRLSDGEYILNPTQDRSRRRARPRRRRHPQCGDDGRIRSQGAFGRRHARRRHVRPRASQQVIDGHHQPGRAKAAKDPWELEERPTPGRQAALRDLIGAISRAPTS
jgi:hypothetical protein